MTKKKYWYKYFFGECPVCGSDNTYKERMYTKKPKDRRERYVHLRDLDTYDGCMGV